jgi:riboflavin kinase/FMN adenylyltransferase
VTTCDIQKFGVANIGVRPTVSDEGNIMLEVHIFDFTKDIYGEDIKVEFLHFIRPERKFQSIANLKTQVQKDIKDAQYALKNIKI